MNQEHTRAPHRPPSADTPQHSAALLIDFDNVTMGIRSNLGQELRTLLDSDIIRGKVAVQRAYADWRRYPQYIVPLSEASIDLIFAPAYGSSKKNATDIRLAIDALELVFIRPEIGTYILLSGDSDFSSLVLKLKEYGKYVIGVGLQESTSDILVQNCDEYYSYNRLSGLTSNDELQTQKHDPWDLASKAIGLMAERGDVMRSDRLKQVMLELDPGFDEKTVGFSKFNRFLGEAAQRELIRLRKRENGQYDVAPPDGAPRARTVDAGGRSAPRRDTGSRNRRGRRGGRSGGGRTERSPAAEAPAQTPAQTPSSELPPSSDLSPSSEPTGADDGLQAAYGALVSVVEELYDGDSPVRDSMAKRKLLQRDASFDEGTLGFSKFSRFLQQADEDGIVELHQLDDGNYYLTPAAGPGKGASESRPERQAAGSRGRGSADRGRSGQRRRSTQSAARRDDASGAAGATVHGPAAETDESGDDPDGRKDGSPFSAAAAAARRTFGRFRRGSASAPATADGGTSSSRMGPIEAAPREASKDEGRPATGASPAAKEKPAREREPAGAERPEQHAEGSRRPDRPARSSRSPGSGRSGRSEAPTKSDSDRTRGTGVQPESRAGASSAGSRPAARPDPDPEAPSARRGLGRYRSGARGRSSPSSTGGSTASRIGPIEDEGPSATTEPAGPASTAPLEPAPEASDGAGGSDGGRTATANGAEPGGDASGPIDHMVRNYAGVGKRTAEVLYEAFGERVFEVIDHEPDRLTEVLSEGRARVVVDARRAERED